MIYAPYSVQKKSWKGRHGNNPVWHELTEMRAFVADRLALDKDRVLGPSRSNNDFGDAVLDMIGNLKRSWLR